MKKNKLWKHPYHKGIDWSAENEAKAFGYPSHAAFVEEIMRRMESEDVVKDVDLDALRKS